MGTHWRSTDQRLDVRVAPGALLKSLRERVDRYAGSSTLSDGGEPFALPTTSIRQISRHLAPAVCGALYVTWISGEGVW
jgi:hypothetical protein